MPITLAPLRASCKTLLVLLLIVAQLAAPLVHAHVGGEVEPGSVHLPGMEALTVLADQAACQANGQQQALPGMVVSIATGLQHDPLPALAAADTALLSLPAPAITQTTAPVPPGAVAVPPFLPSPRYRHALPRAPPSLTV